MLDRIYPEALTSSLEKGLRPFYLLNGQDLLLIGEAKDSIVATARQQAFDEKLEVTIANETKWDDLFDQVQSGGLFFTRQILILNLPETLTAAQQKQLAELLSFSHEDLLFILHLPKFAKAIEKQKWFTTIQNNALLINCQTPDISKMPTWLYHRAKAMQLALDQDAIQYLSYNYEGNLLALKQALQLLQLRFAEQKITLARVKEIVEQSSQFTPFQWIDALLAGKINRASRILNHLKNEEVQPVVLLRIIQKELMILLEITRPPQPNYLERTLFNGHLSAEFQRLKIWQTRQSLYQSAVNRLSYRQLFLLIQTLAELEKKVKQECSDDVWNELERFSIQFR